MEYATVEKLLCAQYPEMVMHPELKFYAETQLLLPKNATPDILQPLEEWMEKVAPTLDGDPTSLHDDEAQFKAYRPWQSHVGHETVIKALLLKGMQLIIGQEYYSMPPKNLVTYPVNTKAFKWACRTRGNRMGRLQQFN